ncbi:hypothetical protein QQ008_07830 [Fulvivirgaceae bacterium BMA10]|uniref:Carboxypeptidase regulatory-like domain-containing protein n=1 Tax=Splendidivirga corallicola TaxID=3051826 RepID=A0ABT8KKM2_9BACT|nr:hypothetical protein [Fulvivirgaceae bacterium BMA10]
MKTFYFFSLVLLTFACDPIGLDEDITPKRGNTTGGDDEDPIIQGSVIFPEDSESDTLVMLMDIESSRILDFTLTNKAGRFCLKSPKQKDLAIRLVNPSGGFVTSDSFRTESLPLLLKV